MEKLWNVRDSGDSSNNDQVEVKEMHRWEPSTKKITSSKVEPITAVAFAPTKLNLSSIVLAVSLENGLIEIWSIPIDINHAKTHSALLHLVPMTDCHISSVKKRWWKPASKDEESAEHWDCTLLASCSTDHEVRIGITQSEISRKRRWGEESECVDA